MVKIGIAKRHRINKSIHGNSHGKVRVEEPGIGHQVVAMPQSALVLIFWRSWENAI
jgi:hypothetical protein